MSSPIFTGRRRQTRGAAIGRRGRRAPTDWARLSPTPVIVLAAGAKTLVATFTLSNPGIAETVRRTLISMAILPLAAGSRAAVGLMVATDAAVAVGAAALPSPVVDASDDLWFWWYGHPGQAINVPVVNALFFESRAMRRVEEGKQIVLMAAGDGAGSNLTIAVSILASRSS